MDSGYEAGEHRKMITDALNALNTLETPDVDAIEEYKKMLERSQDPSYKPWTDPEWLASSQEMLDMI
jgi:hypothetical protein